MPDIAERVVTRTGSMTVDVFAPRTAGPHPGCIIVHGTFGLLPQFRSDIVSFADALTSAGVVAFLPHYFESTGTAPGLEAGQAIPVHLADWVDACGAAFLFARGHAGVDAGRLAAIGFSLGGHIALDLAMARPGGTSLKCVVDFFGPVVAPPLPGNRALLPPVQIHHGTDDRIVPIRDSEQLVAELRAAGKAEGVGYQFLKYAGQGHGFTGADLAASRSTAASFVSGAL
jgi:dienelactone hydrolase